MSDTPAAPPRPLSSECATPRWSRRTTLLLAALLLLAAALKVHYQLGYAAVEPLADAPYGDSVIYLEEAQRHFAEGPAGAFYKPPAYSFLLATARAGAQDGRVRMRVVQVACGLVMLAGVFVLARSRGGDAAGALAFLLALAYAPLTFHETKLLDVTCATTAMVCAAVLLDRSLRGGGTGWIVAAGVAGGLAAITWAGMAATCVVIIAWLLARRRLRAALAMAIGVALCVAPVASHNLRAGGSPVIAFGDGHSFLVGNNPEARGSYSLPPGYPDGILNERFHELDRARDALGRQPTAAEQRSHSYDEAFAYLAEDPWLLPALVRDKLLFAVSSRELGDNDILSREQERFGLLRWARLPFLPLLLLGLLGLACRSARDRLPIVAPVIGGLVVLLSVFVVSRYRAPLAPFLAVGGGLALAGAWSALRGRRVDHVPWVGVALAGCALLLATAAPPPVSDRDLDRSEQVFDVVLDAHAATSRAAAGDKPGALDILVRSLLDHPNEPAAGALLLGWIAEQPASERPPLCERAATLGRADPRLLSLLASVPGE